MRAILGPRARDSNRCTPGRSPPVMTRGGSRTGASLFAGDAAGVVDPMTGEGIAQALETGMLAARRSQPAPTTRSSCTERSGATCASRRSSRRSCAIRSAPRAAIRAADLNDWTAAQLLRWMWEDYPRALLGTPDRWHRGALALRRSERQRGGYPAEQRTGAMRQAAKRQERRNAMIRAWPKEP